MRGPGDPPSDTVTYTNQAVSTSCDNPVEARLHFIKRTTVAILTLHVTEWFSVGVSPLMPKANTMGFFHGTNSYRSKFTCIRAHPGISHPLPGFSLPYTRSCSYREWENKQGFNICECIHQECILPDFFLLTMKLEFLW